jgi:hypothetical protein
MTKFSLLSLVVLVTAVIAPSQNTNKLSTPEQTLVDDSKQAIIATGVSDSYFNAHFKAVRVETKTSDRRVVWQFTINDHQAVVTDSIGYYTQGTQRIDTHSIAQSLGHTNEITKTIPRARALQLMRRCIGNYADPSVIFGSVNGVAELLLTAHLKPNVSRREREEREQEEAREREKEKRNKKPTGVDEVENEGEEDGGEPVIIGYINLQTGRCTKGKGLSTP